MRTLVATLSFSVLISVQALDQPTDAMLGDVTTIDESRYVEAASRRRQRLETSPQPIVVLDERALANTPATTLPDRLRYVPGIDVVQERHGMYDVGMRGYNSVGNNRVLVLRDGVDQRWEGLGSTNWIGFGHPSDLARVEIAKGPGSVTYGANAFGGVIAMSGRNADAEHRSYTVGAVGSDGREELDTTALGPLGEVFDYKLSAGVTRLDDLPATTGITGPGGPDHQRIADSGESDLSADRIGGELGWRLFPEGRLSAGYHFVRMNEWELVDDYDVGSNHTDWDFHSADAEFALPWGSISYGRQWADYFYSNQKTQYPAPGYPDFRYAQAGFSDSRDTLRAQGTVPLSNHALTVGGELLRYNSQSRLWKSGSDVFDESTWGSVTTYNRAIFAEDQWAVAPRWILTGGARLDNHSRVGLNTSPRAAVNWVPDDDQFVLLSVSRGYRLPNFIESYIESYYFDSDPDLKVETISAIELGWNKRTADGRTTLAINGFANRSQDQIWMLPLDLATMQANYFTWLGTGPDLTKQPGPFFSFANLDNPVTVFGTELSARTALEGTPLSLWGNTTWQRYRHQDDVVYQSAGFIDPFGALGQGPGGRVFAFDSNLGDDINAPPEWMANLGLDVEHRQLFAGIAGRYVDSRRIFSFANSSFSGGTVRTQEINDYVACDLHVGFELGRPGERESYLRFAIMDLFDTAHHEWYQATSDSLAAAYERELVSDIGRTVTFEMKLTF